MGDPSDVHLARFRPRPRANSSRAEQVGRAARTALSAYATLSAGNGPDRQAVLELNAREFVRGEGIPQARVLSRTEFENICPGLPTVEGFAEAAVTTTRRTHPSPPTPPYLFGTFAHTALRDSINGLYRPDTPVAER